jgi:hypothetical protein
MCRRGLRGYSAPDGNRIPREVLVTTIEKSVGVRVPANEHEGTAGHTAQDTPHGGVVKSNRPDERTDAVPPTRAAGAEPYAVEHHDADYGQHMA